ncbi:alpha/beta fold hydrolase [Acetobacteraceae bacterium H6797]|nr:alpha/beta fold hydrolase [Acetobacteraceae bacterium H6797]
MSQEETGRLARPDGTELAWARIPAKQGIQAPGIVFLGGFRSDMEGSKALFLRDWCAAQGLGFLRFDYSGHGQSGGRFEEGTIGQWAADAALVIEALTTGPQILVGSSMGGWISLLLARRNPERVAALVGIAAAPDFTALLMGPALTEAQRADIARDGLTLVPSLYGDPYPITGALLADGEKQSVLDAPLPLPLPVRLLQGMADPDVPWQHAIRIVEAIEGPDVQLHLIKDGDHRLSRPEDLALLGRTIAALLP